MIAMACRYPAFLILKRRPTLKTADAKRVLEAARSKAADIGKPVSVAIVDAAGAMVVFERINDAPPFTAVVAEGKAAGSAFTGRGIVSAPPGDRAS